MPFTDVIYGVEINFTVSSHLSSTLLVTVKVNSFYKPFLCFYAHVISWTGEGRGYKMAVTVDSSSHFARMRSEVFWNSLGTVFWKIGLVST